eukprot:991515_1
MGRQLVTKILFKGLHDELNNNTMDNIQNMNAIIHQIEQSRDNNKESENDKEAIVNLSTLPSVMISEISSYLEIMDTINFKLSSRDTCIGIHSPHRHRYPLREKQYALLVEFNATNKESCQKMWIPRFKSAEINFYDIFGWEDDAYYVEHPALEIMESIDTLQIHYGMPNQIDMLLCHLIAAPLLNIKTLRILPDDDEPYRMDNCNAVLESIGRCLQPECFELCAEFREPVPVSYLHTAKHEWIRKLKGFALNNLGRTGNIGHEQQMVNGICSSIGTDLES